MDKGKIIGYYDFYFDEYEYSRIGKVKGKLYVDSPLKSFFVMIMYAHFAEQN